MQAHVKEGKLTRKEQAFLVDQVRSKVAAGEKLEKRLAMLEDIDATFEVPFRNGVLLTKVATDLAKIEKIEKQAKGRNMTMKELKICGERGEVEDKLREILEKERGWWEPEQDWSFRRDSGLERIMEGARRSLGKVSGGSSGGKKSVSAVKKPAGGGWTTTGAAKKGTIAGFAGGGGMKRLSPTAKKKGGGGGGLFAAMMDSDSDSD